MKKVKRKNIESTESTDINNGANEKKKAKKDLYKQPTVDELNQLRETENLFHSNLFRLQIEELLANTKIKEKHKKSFDSWFKKFVENVRSIEDSEQIMVSFYI